MIYYISAASARGARTENQDCLLVCAPARNICHHGQDSLVCTFSVEQYESVVAAVADGVVARPRSGRTASLALSALAALAEHEDGNPARWAKRVNEAVCPVFFHPETGEPDGSSTLSLLQLKNDCATAVNVGDSPILRWRAGELTPMYQSHTLAHCRARQGMRCSPRDERRLAAFLGTPTSADLSYSTVTEVLPGDSFLICSDGLTDTLDWSRISAILAKKGQNSAEELLYAASSGRDNITAVVIHVAS